VLSIKYSLYDCFADRSFAGHTAAIVEVPQKPEYELAKKVSVELCQTITCFVWREKNRIQVESLAKDGAVWLVNHGLLGVAKHFVKEQDVLYSAEAKFEVRVSGDSVSIAIPRQELNLMEMPERLNQAFDVVPVSVREIGATCLVELRTVKEVIDLEIDFNRISKLDYDRIVITAEDDTVSFDYVYRYFSPKHSVNENNGSLYVQTFLPIFWQERLGKNDFSFWQPSVRKSSGYVSVEKNCIRLEAPVRKIFDGTLKVL